MGADFRIQIEIAAVERGVRVSEFVRFNRVVRVRLGYVRAN